MTSSVDSSTRASSFADRAAIGDRWRLLETVRVYALERLGESGELAEARARHLAWTSTVAQELERRIGGDSEWEAEFDAVVDDLRAALAGVSPGPDQSDDAYTLALACGHLMLPRHFPAEAQSHYEEAAALAAMTCRPRSHCAPPRMSRIRACGGESYPLLLAAADRYEAGGDDGAAAIALAYAASYAQRFPGEYPEPIGFEESENMLRRAQELAPSDDAVAQASLLTAEAWLTPTPRPIADGALAARAVAATRALGDPVLLSNALDGLTTAALVHSANA